MEVSIKVKIHKLILTNVKNLTHFTFLFSNPIVVLHKQDLINFK